MSDLVQRLRKNGESAWLAGMYRDIDGKRLSVKDDCAEAAAEIERLRSIIDPGTAAAHEEGMAALLAERDELRADAERLTDVLRSAGFTPCYIAACNCGSWHHRYGLPERWQEIKDALTEADALNNDTGNKPLLAVQKLIEERDKLRVLLKEAHVRMNILMNNTIHTDDCAECAFLARIDAALREEGR